MNEKIVRVGVGVFVIRSGKFLMGLRKGSHGAGEWSLPGGHLEYGEEWDVCGCREVAEETGCKIANVRYLSITNFITMKKMESISSIQNCLMSGLMLTVTISAID